MNVLSIRKKTKALRATTGIPMTAHNFWPMKHIDSRNWLMDIRSSNKGDDYRRAFAKGRSRQLWLS